jgi:hypothetical protein
MFLPHVIGVWYNKLGNSRHRLFDDEGALGVVCLSRGAADGVLDPNPARGSHRR